MEKSSLSRKTFRRGFTLAEVLVVASVLMILLAGYVSLQKKLLDWKNEIELESRSDSLRKLFESYYLTQLKRLVSGQIALNPGQPIPLLPFCRDGLQSAKNTGIAFICAADSAGRTRIDYGQTRNLARQVLNDLSSVGAGADLTNPYDPWNRPLVFVVFLPTLQGGAYCPTTDFNSPKVIIISLGPDGKLNTPSGMTATDFLSSAILDTGAFDPNFDVLGDDLLFSFSTDSINADAKIATETQLSEYATLFKNYYFDQFYDVIRDPSLGADPTAINFFLTPFANSGCNGVDFTHSTAWILQNVFGLTEADSRDQFGNFLCFDPDINRSLASASFNRVGTMCLPREETSASGFISRIFSVCAVEAANRPDCSSSANAGDLWPGATSISDPSLIQSISGMY